MAALAIAAIAAGVYATALGNGFVWDDRLILEKQLHVFSGPLAPFFPPDVPQASDFYYRPLVTVTYLVDQALGGRRPFPFHLTPVLLHAVASGLVCLLFVHVLGPRAWLPALAGALVFAVHPVHAEVVAWMAGRAESLATIGVVGALLAWGAWLETRHSGRLVGGAAALFCGLLGKETALAGVPLAATLPWVWPHARDRRAGRPLCVVLAITVIAYVGLRTVALGTGPGFARTVPLAETARGVAGALGFYAMQLVWPRATAPVLTSAPIDTPHVVVGILATLGFVAAVALALYRRATRAAWGLLWIGAGLVAPLVLVVRAISETPIADRYLYGPSAGAAFLIAVGIAGLPARRIRIGAGAVALAVVVAGVVSARRSLVWRDNLVFWQNAVAAAPDEGFALMKLGLELGERGDRAGAEARYREALGARLSPWQRAVVANNLGHLLLAQRRCPEAEPLFRAAVATGPRFAGPYRGLAECLMMRVPASDRDALREIRGLLENALRFEPTAARSALLLAQTHLAEGNRGEAVRWFTRAVDVAPDSPSAARAREALATLERP